MSHGGGRPQGSRNKSKGHDRQAGAIKVAVSTRIGGGFFNSMQAEGKQKFKMEVVKIYRLMFDPDDDRREVDASEIAMKGKIFQALVVDYKMSQGEVAVEVEWKGAPADLLRGVKDRKQVIRRKRITSCANSWESLTRVFFVMLVLLVCILFHAEHINYEQ